MRKESMKVPLRIRLTSFLMEVVMRKQLILSILTLALIVAGCSTTDTMKSKDSMAKDTMAKDGMKMDAMGKDTMAKDAMATDVKK